MTRVQLAVGFLFLCVFAAPFFKAYLERRGVGTPLAYVGGITVDVIGVLAVALARH